MKAPIYFIGILGILASLNCDLIRLIGSSDNNIVRNSVVMFDDSSKIDLSTDPLHLSKTSVKNDMLTLIVGYSGGCKEHLFKLYAWKAIAKSYPPQAELFLSHNGNGDLCEAYITQELKFDLTPLQLYMRKNFNYSGAVILRIYSPGKIEPFEPKPVYNFN